MNRRKKSTGNLIESFGMANCLESDFGVSNCSLLWAVSPLLSEFISQSSSSQVALSGMVPASG